MGEYQICIEIIEKEVSNSQEKIGLLKKLAFKLAEDAKPGWTHSQPGKPIATPTLLNRLSTNLLKEDTRKKPVKVLPIPSLKKIHPPHQILSFSVLFIF